MSDSPHPEDASANHVRLERARDLALAGFALSLFLLPFGAAYEAGLLLCWISVFVGWRAGFVWSRSALSLIGWVFGGYFLAALLALPDAVALERSAAHAAGLLRFLGFGFAALLLDTRQWQRLPKLIAAVVALWLLDAVIQAVFGVGLRGVSSSDRLSGIFGDNLKLGPVLALLAPITVVALARRWHWQCAALVALGLVILLAGTRSAWVMFAVVLVCWGDMQRRQHGIVLWKVLIASVLALAVALPLLQATWPSFAHRIERTKLLLDADRASVDEALAFRLPIWETALTMAWQHPVNGVGTRGFRHAYRTYAAPGDRWLAVGGALHPHHVVLEILAETGLLGLSCWLLGLWALWRARARADEHGRSRSWPYAVALLAMLFPLNTHLAFYSSFWGFIYTMVLSLCLAAVHSPGAASRAERGAHG